MFHNNKASSSGGVLYGSDSIIELTNCQFINSTAGISGGAIVLFDWNLQLSAWNDSHQSPITIQGNSAMVNGGFMSAYDSTITIGHYHFKNNSAKYGGVFLIGNTSLTLLGSSDFTLPIVFDDNIATYRCGLIDANNNSSITTLKGTLCFAAIWQVTHVVCFTLRILSFNWLIANSWIVQQEDVAVQ
jgi:predicted outer membrane repeat protein